MTHNESPLVLGYPYGDFGDERFLLRTDAAEAPSTTLHVPLREGARVQIVAGDLAGDNATIDSWEYRTLAYNHQPSDERLYWLVVDGGFGRVPALREQLASFDEVYG